MRIPTDINFLVVDDFLSVRKMLKTGLRKLGHTGKIHEAENVEQAKKVLAEMHGTPDEVHFIMSDWEMPGEELGIDFLRTIRADERYKTIPFIMITAVNEKDNVLKAIMAGASNYLTKPWNFEDFNLKLNMTWQKHNK